MSDLRYSGSPCRTNRSASTYAFKVLSVQAIAAFLMGFGWGGLGAFRGGGRTASAADRAVLVEPTNDSVTHCYAFGYPVADTLWITSDIQNERAAAAGVGRARYEASPGERRPKVAVRSWCDDADREEVESGCHQRSPVARAHRASPVGRVIPYLDRTVTTEAIPLWPTHGRPVGLSGQRASKPGGRWSGPLKRRAH